MNILFTCVFAKVSTNHLPIKCLVNCPGWPFTAHDSIDELLQCHLQTNGTCRSQNGRPSVCENFCLTQRWENLFGNFFTKKHHRSRSTGKTRLYHDFSNTNTGNSHKSAIHNIVCQSSPSPLSNRWNSAAPWLDMKSC